MAFAASLTRRTINKISSFAEEVDYKIAKYTDEVIKDFQKACEERASEGYVNHSATFTHTVDGLWKAQVYNSQAQAAQAMETSLRSGLGSLGFSSVKVRSERRFGSKQNRWMSWNFSTNQVSVDQQVRFIIDVAWPGMESIEEPDESEHRIASGTEISCPICFETRPAVALIPCGHTVCHECVTTLADSSNNRCASCRRQVTGFTEGLFIG